MTTRGTTYAQCTTAYAAGSTFTRDHSQYTTFNSAATVSLGGVGFTFNASSDAKRVFVGI